MNDIDRFKAALDRSERIVGFTGAGISTESGIQDYRSQGGIWEKFQPVYLDEFLADESKRLLHWQSKKALWQEIRDATVSNPFIFQRALRQQQTSRADHPEYRLSARENLASQGGAYQHRRRTNLEVICMKCKDINPAHETLDDLDLVNGAPLCVKCGGLLKPNTISFGQSLIPEDLERAQDLALSCDMMIAAGSTLVVQPAAAFPLIAKQNGAILAIITQSDTPLDDTADFVFHEKLGDFIDKLGN